MINVVEKGNALEDLKRVLESNREEARLESISSQASIGVPNSKPIGFEKYSEYADMMIRC